MFSNVFRITNFPLVCVKLTDLRSYRGILLGSNPARRKLWIRSIHRPIQRSERLSEKKKKQVPRVHCDVFIMQTFEHRCSSIRTCRVRSKQRAYEQYILTVCPINIGINKIRSIESRNKNLIETLGNLTISSELKKISTLRVIGVLSTMRRRTRMTHRRCRYTSTRNFHG